MTDFDDKLKILNKVAPDKSKHLLVENELKKLQHKIENYKYMIPVFLSIKSTLSVMEHKFT